MVQPQPVKEQAILLGARKSLVGVIAQPSVPANDAGRPAVVMLNAGIIHRVGPNRMVVALARVLAAAGHLVLRFDLSGIGDSEARADGLPPIDAALADIKEALDSLQSARGVQRVILVGLCSGADHAAIYSGSDPRVVGVVLLDPSIPPTRRYRLRYWMWRMRWLGGRVASPQGAAHLLSRLFDKARGSESGDEALEMTMTPSLDSREVRNFLEQAYQRALDGGVHLLAVFTAGREDRHNYRTQMLEAFPNVQFGEQLQLEYFDDADHVFTSRDNRARLTDLLQRWIGSARFETTAARMLSAVGGDVPGDRLGQSGSNVVRGPVAE